uniref:Coiled-coil-helix-coiled-coil-helix domain-containing protein 3, mitochondrial-like n=1 Tax=Stegastes partitus TaxID=144197 RepID=A0A3B5A969_9TELE
MERKKEPKGEKATDSAHVWNHTLMFLQLEEPCQPCKMSKHLVLMLHRLEAEKARATSQAQAEAHSQVQDEVSRILTVERSVAHESIQQAVIRERIATEDQRLRAQLFAKQLEAREADLKKQDAFYREQVARLEERSAQFYKVTTENYHKAADQVNAKFRRYELYPVCADLQGQILACYKDNVGKTLHCSNIAAQYLQCVNDAKQVNRTICSRRTDKVSPSFFLSLPL